MISFLNAIIHTTSIPYIYMVYAIYMYHIYIYIHIYMKWSEFAQSCPTLCDPMDCSPPGSSVHGIFQARVLEWVAISFYRGSSWPRDRTRVSHIVGRRFTVWATHTHIYIGIYAYRFTCNTHTHTYIHIHTHYICLCVYIYIYIYTHTH